MRALCRWLGAKGRIVRGMGPTAVVGVGRLDNAIEEVAVVWSSAGRVRMTVRVVLLPGDWHRLLSPLG